MLTKRLGIQLEMLNKGYNLDENQILDSLCDLGSICSDAGLHSESSDYYRQAYNQLEAIAGKDVYEHPRYNDISSKRLISISMSARAELHE